MKIDTGIWDALTAAAITAGEADGAAAGTWAVDGNTSTETCAALVAGIDDGDPEVLDGLPWLDLSADGPCGGDVINAIVNAADDLGDPDVFLAAARDLSTEDEDALLDAYREAYDRAVQDEVYRAAAAQLPQHADYPHTPGTLYDCPACEASGELDAD